MKRYLENMSAPDYKKIIWKSNSEKKKGLWGFSIPSSDLTLEAFFEYSKSQQPPKTLLKSFDVFISERNHLHEVFKKTIETLSLQSFLAAFLVWVKEFAHIRSDILEGARMLLEMDLIGIKDEGGEIWTIEKARGFDHSIILDAIRCERDLPIQLREHLVSVYIYFMQWLWGETHGYINKLEDPDYHKSIGKGIAFPLFIEFLAALKDKEQLVAKLLYFGKDPTIEEVLDIELEDIDFEAKTIRYKSATVNYPAHIFADIKTLVQKRKRGHVFLGRQEAPLNRATVFRNFKEAALQAGLGETFSPKNLSAREGQTPSLSDQAAQLREKFKNTFSVHPS